MPDAAAVQRHPAHGHRDVDFVDHCSGGAERERHSYPEFAEIDEATGNAARENGNRFRWLLSSAAAEWSGLFDAFPNCLDELAHTDG